MVGSSIVLIGGHSQEGQSLLVGGWGGPPRLSLLLPPSLALLPRLPGGLCVGSAPLSCGLLLVKCGQRPPHQNPQAPSPPRARLWQEPCHWSPVFTAGTREGVEGLPGVCTAHPARKSHRIPLWFCLGSGPPLGKRGVEGLPSMREGHSRAQ